MHWGLSMDGSTPFIPCVTPVHFEPDASGCVMMNGFKRQSILKEKPMGYALVNRSIASPWGMGMMGMGHRLQQRFPQQRHPFFGQKC
jgi:hypothetical protein